MGAVSFIVSVRAETPREGYDSLVKDAKHDYGHNPYNGTISTTSGLSYTKYPDPMPANDNDLLAWISEVAIERATKWGPALCVKSVTEPDLYYYFGWAAE